MEKHTSIYEKKSGESYFLITSYLLPVLICFCFLPTSISFHPAFQPYHLTSFSFYFQMLTSLLPFRFIIPHSFLPFLSSSPSSFFFILLFPFHLLSFLASFYLSYFPTVHSFPPSLPLPSPPLPYEYLSFPSFVFSFAQSPLLSLLHPFIYPSFLLFIWSSSGSSNSNCTHTL